MTTATQSRTERPVKTFRCGRIQAAIWVNETARSTTRHNVTVSRSFKRTPESQWEQSTSFSREQALVAASLLQRAHNWINDEIERNGSTDEQDGDPDDDGTPQPVARDAPVVSDAELDQQTEQCPICKNENPAGTTRCDHCGSCTNC